MFDDLTEPLLSMVALTLTVCLLIVAAMAAIGRDRDGVRGGLAFAGTAAVICVLTQFDETIGWVGVGLFVATMFGWYALSIGANFVLWFAVSLAVAGALVLAIYVLFDKWLGLPIVISPLITLGVFRFVIWLRGRGSTYGAADLAPA